MSSAPERPPADLTCVLVDGDEHDADSIRRAVAARNYGDGWLRVKPLSGSKLLQVEVLDAAGLPRIDPGLVEALSVGDRRATFVHVNHDAKQALVHAFVGGRQLGDGGWVGDPAEIDAKLAPVVGRSLTELQAGDDGTRHGLGGAASHTVALVRGRALTVPVGTSTGLGSFGFHDRTAARHPDGDRVALIAFDPIALRNAWRETAGAELAARLFLLTPSVIGPLRGVRDAAAAALGALGETSPDRAGLKSVIAFELVTLSESYLFAGGEATSFVDERLLPMFSLTHGEPAIDDADEAEELESRASVLEAMGEVLPYASPEGTMLEQIGDHELEALAPWATAGAEYVGSIFLVHPERLRKLLCDTDSRDLAARIDRFYRAWWKAEFDAATGDEFDRWRKKLDDHGAPDVERFLTAWAEWRTVLGMAAKNHLQPALVFYGLDAAGSAG